MKHSEQQQGDILVLHCKPNVGTDIDSEGDDVDGSTAQFVGKFAKEDRGNALEYHVGGDCQVDVLDAGAQIP